MTTDSTPRIDAAFFRTALRDDQLMRLRIGVFDGADLAALRRLLRLTQMEFAARMGLSVDTIQNWEQGRCQPDGPARALIRLLAIRPGFVLKALQPSA